MPETDFSAPAKKGWLNRTIAVAGITSTLGDFCYETTTVILPGFLAMLGIRAAALGRLIEDIADAVICIITQQPATSACLQEFD
ncbi:hypothetical protein [Nitrosomonas communis]|uniref:Uncharacterized protein n=1 Tax=Nitrosomonas communis TaxID=44574 RepID=A0A1I4VF04_9PROT|nr:hypothetical protein [Nitrosomonas communis]SFM99653.1 hypothetical protein SAMN05421863_108110 [Nitrosomonas communis]